MEASSSGLIWIFIFPALFLQSTEGSTYQTQPQNLTHLKMNKNGKYPLLKRLVHILKRFSRYVYNFVQKNKQKNNVSNATRGVSHEPLYAN